MNQEAIITDLLERLREQLRTAIPSQTMDTAMEQVRRALSQGLEEFDLVSRRELEAHLQTLRQLQDTVERLERRIGELEAR